MAVHVGRWRQGTATIRYDGKQQTCNKYFAYASALTLTAATICGALHLKQINTSRFYNVCAQLVPFSNFASLQQIFVGTRKEILSNSRPSKLVRADLMIGFTPNVVAPTICEGVPPSSVVGTRSSGALTLDWFGNNIYMLVVQAHTHATRHATVAA